MPRPGGECARQSRIGDGQGRVKPAGFDGAGERFIEVIKRRFKIGRHRRRSVDSNRYRHEPKRRITTGTKKQGPRMKDGWNTDQFYQCFIGVSSVALSKSEIIAKTISKSGVAPKER
jgi:hypothetical protein